MIVFEPRDAESAGELIGQIGSKAANFTTTIGNIDPTTQFARYSVYSDSVSTYIQVPAVAERLPSVDSTGKTVGQSASTGEMAGKEWQAPPYNGGPPITGKLLI